VPFLASSETASSCCSAQLQIAASWRADGEEEGREGLGKATVLLGAGSKPKAAAVGRCADRAPLLWVCRGVLKALWSSRAGLKGRRRRERGRSCVPALLDRSCQGRERAWRRAGCFEHGWVIPLLW